MEFIINVENQLALLPLVESIVLKLDSAVCIDGSAHDCSKFLENPSLELRHIEFDPELAVRLELLHIC